MDAFISDCLAPYVHADNMGMLVINVRRGDYYSDPTHRARYGFDQLGYVKDALERVGPVDRTLIVSDDPDWCRENLLEMVEATSSTVDFADRNPVSNFEAVASASRIIGTNSTFSYWGAYVSGVVHASPVVVMPRFHGRLPEGSPRTSSTRGGSQSTDTPEPLYRAPTVRVCSAKVAQFHESREVEVPITKEGEGPLSFDASVLEEHEVVGVPYGRESMSHDKDRQAAAQPSQGLGDLVLRHVVEGRSRFVEDQYRRLAVERARKTEALSLAAGEANPTLADHCVQAVRELGHEIGKLRQFDNIPHAGIVHIASFDPEGDVGEHGVIRQEDVLRDYTEGCVPARLVIQN